MAQPESSYQSKDMRKDHQIGGWSLSVALYPDHSDWEKWGLPVWKEEKTYTWKELVFLRRSWGPGKKKVKILTGEKTLRVEGGLGGGADSWDQAQETPRDLPSNAQGLFVWAPAQCRLTWLPSQISQANSNLPAGKGRWILMNANITVCQSACVSLR